MVFNSLRIAILLCLFMAKEGVADWKFKANGEISSQWRSYAGDKLDSTQDNYTDFLTNFKFKAKNYKLWAKGEIESRNVVSDNASSQIYVKEAWIGWLDKAFQIKLGVNYFTWSTLEVFHPIEIINSIEWIDQTKIGEPMLMLEFPFQRKRLNVYLMPLLTDNIYPSVKTRGFGIDLGESWFVKDNNELFESRKYLGGAIHWRHSLNSFDYNLILYSGPDKNLQIITFDGSQFHSLYFLTNMIGLNLQASIFDTSLKMELLKKTYQHSYYSYQPKDHSLLALGWEYPFAFDSGSELYFLVELQKALGIEPEVVENYYIFQNDAFLGFRYQWNDTKARELTSGVVNDLSREKELYMKLEYAQRINARWKFDAGVEAIIAPKKSSQAVGLESLDGQNYIYTKLNYYF